VDPIAAGCVAIALAVVEVLIGHGFGIGVGKSAEGRNLDAVRFWKKQIDETGHRKSTLRL
jgi:hypothetical protein